MKRYLFLIVIAVLFCAADARGSGCNADANFCMDCVQGFKIDRFGNKTPNAVCCMADANCMCFGIDEFSFIQEDRGWGCLVNSNGPICASTHDDDECVISD